MTPSAEVGARNGHVRTAPSSEARVDSSATEAGEEKKRQRGTRRAQLQVGDEFRAYDLFDQFGVIPDELMACKILTSSEKLCWVFIAKCLGKEGGAFPSYERIAERIGAGSRRQAIRLVEGLQRKGFVRRIQKTAAVGDCDSNEYRLLWHEIFAHGVVAKVVSRKDQGSDKMTPPGSDKMTPEKSHHLQKDPFLKREIEKKKNSDDSQRKPVRSAPVEAANRSLEANNGTISKLTSDDEEDEKPTRPRLDDPAAECRARLKERQWLNGSVDVETILGIIEDGLGYNQVRLKAFLNYEESLTTPSKIKSAAAHYRALLKKFPAAEASARKEERREMERQIEAATPESHSPVCPEGVCQGGVIYDDKGRPIGLHDCSVVQRFSPEHCHKLLSDIKFLRAMNAA